MRDLRSCIATFVAVRMTHPEFCAANHTTPAGSDGTRYNVAVTSLLALAAHESGWGTSHMATAQFDPFGATPGGGTSPGLTFTSFANAWQWWGKQYCPAVKGVGGDVSAFTTGLFLVGYNQEVAPLGDSRWAEKVAVTVSSVAWRLDEWLGGAQACK